MIFSSVLEHVYIQWRFRARILCSISKLIDAFNSSQNYLSNDVLMLMSCLQLTSSEEKVSEKYPSFDLILNFVKNEALSVDRVQALLKQREKVARSVAETYAFLAEVVTVMGMGNLFEVKLCGLHISYSPPHTHTPTHTHTHPHTHTHTQQLSGLVLLQQVLSKQQLFPRYVYNAMLVCRCGLT